MTIKNIKNEIKSCFGDKKNDTFVKVKIQFKFRH